MTTVASGFCTSAPAEFDNAIGKKPSDATVAVISTGRSRTAVPSKITLTRSVSPACRSRLNSPISTMPFSTDTPNRAMKPTPAEILKGISRNQRASMPPMAASGMAEKINSDCRTEPNVRNNSKKIRASATGTAIDSRSRASMRFSNCPPYVT